MPKLPTKVIAQLTPYWQSKCGRYMIYKGDNRGVMKLMEENSIHAVVSDPPYGLEFMGKDWDAPWKGNGTVEVVTDEGADVSHPFRDGTQRIRYGRGSTDARQRRAAELTEENKRRFIASAVVYGVGVEFQLWFQQRAEAMLRVCKPGAHCLTFGGTRMFHRMACAVEDARFEIRDTLGWIYGSGFPKSHDVSKAIDRVYGVEREKKEFESKPGMAKSWDTGGGRGFSGTQAVVDEPLTAAAVEWSGWGSALKPAYEPIIMSRKPLTGTIAQNVLEHGVGGINVDGCRVGVDNTPKGRWPANIIHDGSDEVLAVFPETHSAGCARDDPGGGEYKGGEGWGNIGIGQKGFRYGDDGGSAARFFYTAKADKIDRGDHNHHPTVKPTDLMQYLCRLVTPPDGIVLDPFMGSGSTGVACVLEGFRFIGIEMSEEYCDIAVGRLQRAIIDKGLAQHNAPKAVDIFKKK